MWILSAEREKQKGWKFPCANVSSPLNFPFTVDAVFISEPQTLLQRQTAVTSDQTQHSESLQNLFRCVWIPDGLRRAPSECRPLGWGQSSASAGAPGAAWGRVSGSALRGQNWTRVCLQRAATGRGHELDLKPLFKDLTLSRLCL